MSSKRMFVFVLISISCPMVLAMAGCSKSTSAVPVVPARLPSQDPCSLITQSEVETALGPGATMATEDGVMNKLCKLVPAHADPKLDHVTLDVIDTSPESWERIKKESGPDAKQIPNLGDGALDIGGISGIWVRKGNRLVQVFSGFGDPHHKAELYLAERAVSRL